MTEQDWPAWAVEPVSVVAANPDWAEQGLAECRLLTEVLRPWLTPAGVQHVGSTAIPGLAAKPIVDVMAAVADLAAADQIAASLTPHGWHYVPPELDQRPHRRFYVRVQDGRRRAHLHVMLATEARWQDQLLFRDRLRLNPELAQQYADLKLALAAEHADDREAYSVGKAEFVSRMLRGCLSGPVRPRQASHRAI